MGAFIGAPGAHIQTNNFARCFPGMYAIPRIHVGVHCVFTNTVPTGPYRGAGRPEANYALERAGRRGGARHRHRSGRAAAAQSDPAAAIPTRPRSAPPTTAATSRRSSTRRWRSPTTAASRSAAAKSRKRRKLRGIGISCFLEHAGGLPTESAVAAFPGGDTLVLGIGVQNTGQGHATIFPRLIAAQLGIPAAQDRAPAWRLPIST